MWPQRTAHFFEVPINNTELTHTLAKFDNNIICDHSPKNVKFPVLPNVSRVPF